MSPGSAAALPGDRQVVPPATAGGTGGRRAARRPLGGAVRLGGAGQVAGEIAGQPAGQLAVLAVEGGRSAEQVAGGRLEGGVLVLRGLGRLGGELGLLLALE